MKVTVDQAFWDLFPTARITVMSLYGIDNTVDEARILISKNCWTRVPKEHGNLSMKKTIPRVGSFKSGAKLLASLKQKGARSSIEALLKRVHQGREFYPINPLVDLYNSVSMAYALPCGGEDMDKLVGGLSLGQAKGGEPFFPLGAEEDAPALEGEIIYYDQEGAVCRCLNWREAQRTMLTEDTKDAILVIEAINEEQANVHKQLCKN